MSVNEDTFKNALGSFATGVTIVTFKNGEDFHGLTVSAFSSVSLQPPLILVCIKKDSTSHALMAATDGFVVNILSDSQQELAGRFANPGLSSAERYKTAAYQTNSRGVPVFTDTLGHLDCRTVEQLDGGDHTIFLGSVEHADFEEGKKPLLYFRSQFHGL